MAAITIVALVAVVAIALVATGALRRSEIAAPGESSPTPAAASPSPRTLDQAAHAFLDDWVDGGRVVRRDQGGDTVSEGQSYALLIALGIDDEKQFDAIWTWTEEHLQRSDGLLAWRFEDGRIVDDEPAADADLQTARALVLAGDAWDRPDLTRAGAALATAVLEHLTVVTDAGRILLPGRWAESAQPYSYNPSYASPAAFAVLGEATGDPRWGELTTGSRAATTAFLDSAALPPDWGRIAVSGAVQVAAGPVQGDGAVDYGYDAARLSAWYAEACDPADTALAARLVPALGSGRLPAVLDLGGGARTGDEHPLAYVARGLAEASAGDTGRATADLGSADLLAQRSGTYYGAAWAALGPLLATSDVLGGCPAIGRTS